MMGSCISVRVDKHSAFGRQHVQINLLLIMKQ